MAEDDNARERAEQRTLIVPRAAQGNELPRGHQLQEFVVDKLLGAGGYSCVYLAQDTKLGRRVALKEYMPATLALRAPDGKVLPRLPRFQALFDKGLQSFMTEARLLGSFDHPSLVKVYRFWAENGTAYMVMPHYEGITLKRWLADLGTPPSQAWLRDLADSLMAALSSMHDQQCFHRDVAPDNILMLYQREAGNYLEQRPRPVLMDFSAARRVIGDATQNLTAMLKSGYSPVEQYDGEVSLRQGAWTDIYALCAVLYTGATGRVPGSSVARVVRDDLVPASELARNRFAPAFLAAIDAGMRVRPQDRPQTVAALRALMDAPPMPVALPPAAAAPSGPQAAPSPAGPSPWPKRLAVAALVALVLGAVALVLMRQRS
jgi:serine/threonine protein kinase